MRLFRSRLRPDFWIAYFPGEGYVAFPAAPDGWSQRHPARGIDPLDLRQVPARQAFDTGMPGEASAA